MISAMPALADRIPYPGPAKESAGIHPGSVSGVTEFASYEHPLFVLHTERFWDRDGEGKEGSGTNANARAKAAFCFAVISSRSLPFRNPDLFSLFADRPGLHRLSGSPPPKTAVGSIDPAISLLTALVSETER